MSSMIVKRDLALRGCNSGKLAFALYNVYSQEECAELVAQTEARGYEAALLNIGGGQQIHAPGTRKSDRCIWDSTQQAADIWSRIKSFVPNTWGHHGHKVAGLNERLRFLRYGSGEYFRAHMDGAYMRPDGRQRSYLTVLLYLNQDYSGGRTTFPEHGGCEDDTERCVAYEPETGSVVVFQHDVLHEGTTLLDGAKYVMRTDVMYHVK